MLPTQILVPTDLSDGAEEALDYALELAAKLGATVHLLNVVGIPALGMPELGMGMGIAVTTIDTVVVENQRAIDELVARKRAAAFGQVLLRTGDARETILQVCKEVGADLIVMGTHGRRGLKRALLGSIAEVVVRTAPCPVLTVRTSDGSSPGRSEG